MRKKKMSKLSKYVIFCIVLLLIYTMAEFICSTFTSISHDTLTTCVYAAFGGEFLLCALIKIFNIKKENTL